MHVLAVLPQGLEIAAEEELQALGAKKLQIQRRSVAFEADMPCLYRVYLQARLPFRVLREIACFSCKSPSELYKQIQESFYWEKWLTPSRSFRVDVSGTSKLFPHSHFTALQVKNALVDLQRNLWRKRSSIDRNNPDLCLHLHLKEDTVFLSLDGSGESLHRRGYRAAMGEAPLKENIAAGLIKLCGWDQSIPLVDPMCGSGTLLIEAAAIALDLCPSIGRSFNLDKWADFNQKLWVEEKEKAMNKENFSKPIPKIIGCEANYSIAKQAKSNIDTARLNNVIEIKNTNFQSLDLPNKPGILLCNPPYGKRLGNEEDLKEVYKQLGNFLKQKAKGWEFWMLSGNPLLSSAIKMKCSQKIPINNGGIDCRWMKYSIY